MATLNKAMLSKEIVKIDSDGVFVDIDYKSDGLIPDTNLGNMKLKNLSQALKSKFSLMNLKTLKAMSFFPMKKLVLSRLGIRLPNTLKKISQSKVLLPIKSKVASVSTLAFLHFYLVHKLIFKKLWILTSILGKTLPRNIIKINKKRGNVIISRRKYLSDQRSDVRRKVLDTLAEGQVINGVVKNITNYGAFVDIGGVDGLLHITDMTWGRIGHPSEIIKIGDTIAVKVLSFDKEHEKISLGLKATYQ